MKTHTQGKKKTFSNLNRCYQIGLVNSIQMTMIPKPWDEREREISTLYIIHLASIRLTLRCVGYWAGP